MQDHVSQNTKRRVLYHLYVAYTADGAVMTIFGALLPYLIAEHNLNYALAGGVLSFLAVGNLLSSLAYPLISRRWSQRQIITAVTLLVPVVLLVFTRVTSVYAMYVLVAYLGFVKGNITITNAALCNMSTNNSARYQNIMGCTYGIGAFISPFVMSMLTMAGFNWRTILYLLAAVSVIIILSFNTADYSCLTKAAMQNKTAREGNSAAHRKAAWLTTDFILMCLLLFLYLGIENVAQGWFVTYFKDTGIMSASVATLMVSVTWVMIMGGRLAVGIFLGDADKFITILALFGGVLLSSLLMISAHTASVATFSVAIIGLFMSGCYPTTFAAAGPIIGTDAMAMSIFTAVAALGGILIPWIVGVLGDRIGIASAMTLFVAASAIAVGIALVMFLRSRRNAV